ncbi:MAG: hypothetical protein KGV59_06720 [Tenacibaculum sp.]|nr:hypothetical protein [Tenacibaculum sp.]
MIKYLKENISWIKDVFTLFFVAVGTVITILTYRRARATILQPIRTEVIKKQSEILTKLLQILKEHNHSFEIGLDYVNLVQVNVFMILKDYGFVFKEHESMLEKTQGDLAGWIPCEKSNILKDVEIIGTFKESKPVKKESNYGLEKYTRLKKQEIDLDKIYLTKTHSEFARIITDFKNDPFMPTSIQLILTELTNDINNNLSIILKSELEIFMLDFGKTYFKENKAPNFNPIGIYNSFNHSRVHHRKTFEKLNIEIRKYLRIDEKW